MELKKAKLTEKMIYLKKREKKTLKSAKVEDILMRQRVPLRQYTMQISDPYAKMMKISTD